MQGKISYEAITIAHNYGVSYSESRTLLDALWKRVSSIDEFAQRLAGGTEVEISYPQLSNRWPKPWAHCRYCSGSEDKHDPNCPGDPVAMLLRIQELERQIQELQSAMEVDK
jgi:hypothetical protein